MGWPKGKLKSEEHKRKISAAQIGRRQTKETRRRISIALTGRQLSKNHKQKISEASKRLWQNSTHRCKVSKAMTGRKFSEEHRHKISIANIGKKLSSEHKNKIGAANMGKKHSLEARQRISEGLIGRKRPIKTRRKISAALTGKKRSIETRYKISQAVKQMWRDPIWRRNHFSSFYSKSTYPERNLLAILQFHFSGEFRYVGNRACWLSTHDDRGRLYHLNPDFIHRKQNLIIELFGDYWHSKRLCEKNVSRRADWRIKMFAKLGFRTLIIWEHELDDAENVIKRIREFLQKPPMIYDVLLTTGKVVGP